MAPAKRYSGATHLALGILGISQAFAQASAIAADAAYCTAYAAKATSDLSSAIASERSQQFIHDRFYTTCLNAEGQPALPKDAFEAIDVIRLDTPKAACPAPTTFTKTLTRTITVTKAPEQSLCASHQMHTIYTGTSWHCAK